VVPHQGFFGWARVQNRRSDRRGWPKARADCQAIIGTITPRATACSFGAIPAGRQSAAPGRPIRDAPLPGPAQNSDGLLRGGSEGHSLALDLANIDVESDDTLQRSPDIRVGGLVPVGQRGDPKHRRAAQMTGNLADAGCMLSGQIVAINRNRPPAPSLYPSLPAMGNAGPEALCKSGACPSQRGNADMQRTITPCLTVVPACQPTVTCGPALPAAEPGPEGRGAAGSGQHMIARMLRGGGAGMVGQNTQMRSDRQVRHLCATAGAAGDDAMLLIGR
jgi:hypothetical protein